MDSQGWYKGRLVANIGKVDVDRGLRGVRAGGKAPLTDRIFGGWSQESMAGLDLGAGDGSIWLYRDQKHDLTGNVHTSSQFRVVRGDA
jgi:hypothetical protein